MSASTAGKGPGLTLRAANHSGTCRVTLSPARDRALLQVMEEGGRFQAELGVNADELRALARALQQLALAITAASLRDDTTQHGP